MRLNEDEKFGFFLGSIFWVLGGFLILFHLFADSCAEGKRGQECFRNHTCNSGLQCLEVSTKGFYCFTPGEAK